MGRPTELTPELRERFLSLIDEYPFPEQVAVECGIGVSTYYRWTQLGRKGVEPFREFLESVRSRRVAKCRKLAGLIERAVLDDSKNWKGALELLKRIDPKRWREMSVAQQIAKTPVPDMRDGEFWARFERETREREQLIEDRKRYLAESATVLPEVVETVGEEQH